LLHSGKGRVLVFFVSFVLISLCKAFIITPVSRILDRSRFTLFMGFLLVLCLLVLVNS
jgi:hypothetical protein